MHCGYRKIITYQIDCCTLLTRNRLYGKALSVKPGAEAGGKHIIAGTTGKLYTSL